MEIVVFPAEVTLRQHPSLIDPWLSSSPTRTMYLIDSLFPWSRPTSISNNYSKYSFSMTMALNLIRSLNGFNKYQQQPTLTTAANESKAYDSSLHTIITSVVLPFRSFAHSSNFQSCTYKVSAQLHCPIRHFQLSKEKKRSRSDRKCHSRHSVQNWVSPWIRWLVSNFSPDAKVNR